jgi:TP901 family phage tail tape measure protein
MATIQNPFTPELLKSVTSYTDEILKGVTAINKLIEVTDKLISENQKIPAQNNNNTESKKKLTAVEKEENRIRNEQLQTHAKLDKARSQAVISLTKSKLKLQEVNKEVKNNITESKRSQLTNEALKGSINAIKASLSANLIAVGKLTKAEREQSQEGKKLTETIKSQRAELSRVEAAQGNATRGVGKYAEGIRTAATSLIGAFGLVGGVAAFAKILTSATQTVIQYSKANSVLASVLGKTKKEIVDLTNDSLAFGKSTQFTSVQVAQLQTELAKLGFNNDEIRNSTRSILDLALATDSELAPAAKVAGSTLRALGLDASEMERVSSVLAVATTKSALSFEDYEGNLSTVLPVAKKFGFSLEDTIALLGKLRDSGFDASSAATATRKIFLNMADANGALAKTMGGSVKNFDQMIDALVKMNKEGFDLGETLELTDVKSVSAFSTFVEGAESARTLRNNITGVNDALKVMVETRTENAASSMIQLGSAWDGVVLKFKDSEGFIKNFLDEITSILNKITDETDAVDVGATGAVDSTIKFWKENSSGAEEYLSNIERARNAQGTLTSDALNAFLEASQFNKTETKRIWETQVEIGNRLGLEIEKARNDAAADGLAKRFDIENKSLEDLKKIQMSFSSFTTGEMKQRGDLILPLIAIQIKQREDAEIELNKKIAKEKRDSLKGSGAKLKEETKVLEEEKKKQEAIILGFENTIQGIELSSNKDRISENKSFEDKMIQNALDGAAKRRFISDRDAKEHEYRQTQIRDISIDLAAQAAQGLSDVLFEGASQRRDAELERVDEQRSEDLERVDAETEVDLANVQDKFDRGLLTEDQAAAQRTAINVRSAEEKAKVEDEAAQRTAAIKTKQAKADKLAAISQIAISAAVGVAQAYAASVATFGASLLTIPFTLASAAIQTAVVLATPIPKFKDGTHGKFNTPSQFVAGEAGKEIIKRPNGSMFITPNKATMYSDMAGSQVIPHKESMAMLDGLGIGYSSNFSDSNIVGGLSRIEKALKQRTSITQRDGVITKRGNRMIERNHSRLDKMKS